MKALLALFALGAAVFMVAFALNDWGHATFGGGGWTAVCALSGGVIGLVSIGVWAIAEARR